MNALKNLRSFITDYCHFADPEIVRPLSLWIAATYLFEAFDSFPYLVITARVKRAGKTRLSELIGFTCSMPMNVAGASAPSLFRAVKDTKPTIIWDEAEQLSSESASLVRTFINVGYRKGQTIPRTDGKYGIIQWPTYCPKIFVLIGDVYDTLRDRSIICEMQRGEPKKRFSYETAKTEGAEIAEEIRQLVAENLEAIQDAYENTDLPFLTDRDAEIWRAIFAIGSVLDRDNDGINLLSRIATDMATEKTADVKKYGYVNQEEQEKIVQREEYARKLLSDMLNITSKLKAIESNRAIAALKEITIAPWRKYQGTGIDMNMLADLLGIFELRPKVCRVGEKVFRGYTRKDILSCAKKYKVTQ